jgi:hypothetical protein
MVTLHLVVLNRSPWMMPGWRSGSFQSGAEPSEDLQYWVETSGLSESWLLHFSKPHFTHLGMTSSWSSLQAQTGFQEALSRCDAAGDSSPDVIPAQPFRGGLGATGILMRASSPMSEQHDLTLNCRWFVLWQALELELPGHDLPSYLRLRFLASFGDKS